VLLVIAPLALLVIAAIAVLAAAVAGVVGFGIGSLVTPALAVHVGTKAAVAIVAVPHMVATGLRLWHLRSSVDREVLATFGLASAAGGLIGAFLYATFANAALTAALGILLVLSGVAEFSGVATRLPLSRSASIGAGALSGLFGGLVGNQGGIRSAALLHFGLPREALVATATATALLVDAARVPVYLVTASSDLVRGWPIVLVLVTAVVVGTLLGVPILRRLSEALFRRILAVLLVLVGLTLVATVLVEA
jgi:uncharacterized protein